MRHLIITAVLFTALVSGARADESVSLKSDAPGRYTVVRGDTLWGIAGKYLRDPWKWPRLWKMNRAEVRNPNRIYPGDVLVLDRRNGTLRLERQIVPTVKLDPRVRSEAVDTSIPAIPVAAIRPFLTQPLVVDEAGLTNTAQIVAGAESRVFLGRGDVAYANVKGEVGSTWHVYRPAKPLIDPDNGKVLGYNTLYLGDAQVTQAGDPATLAITLAREEIGVGDKLLPHEATLQEPYTPHAPEAPIRARIISGLDSLDEFGPNTVVILNKGAKDGLERGHVLALMRYRAPAPYRDAKDEKKMAELPEERYGLLMVFRTFDKVSFALVMNASRPAQPHDVATNP